VKFVFSPSLTVSESTPPQVGTGLVTFMPAGRPRPGGDRVLADVSSAGYPHNRSPRAVSRPGVAGVLASHRQTEFFQIQHLT